MAGVFTFLFYIVIITLIVRRFRLRGERNSSTSRKPVQRVDMVDTSADSVSRPVQNQSTTPVQSQPVAPVRPPQTAAGTQRMPAYQQPVKRENGISSHMTKEKINRGGWEDRKHDWLARQMAEERVAKKRMSEMFQLKEEHKYNCEAEMLRQFHESHCEAEKGVS